ncbi:class IV adenylate cyclase [Streptomyces sp. NPDC050509]|uniref:class IV adenylate cyclase n=1 Tax=Streptomyces sp. NPDC050509 TaxID=3365620 RepID=UPI0037A0DB97
MIEAELKACVHAPEAVTQELEKLATARVEVYQDTYFDSPNRCLDKQDQELRLRTVHGTDGVRTLLTFKDATVDETSGAKPEHETLVADAEAAHAIVKGLGYAPVITFEKRCRNYRFEAAGRAMLATLVRVPEVDGTYIEVETLVAEDDVQAALADVRAVLQSLGIGQDDLTRELYTDAVIARRGERTESLDHPARRS